MGHCDTRWELLNVIVHLVMQANMIVALHTWREPWLAPSNECCGSERELVVQGVGRTFRVPEHAYHDGVFVSSGASPAPRG